METNTTLKDYDRLIHNQAWTASKKWGIDEPEMYAEGLFIFLTSLPLFNPGRGIKFSTYLTHRLKNKLDKYGAKEKNVVNRFDLLKNYNGDWSNLFLKRFEYHETISSDLSDDARNVLGLILQSLENTCFNRRPSLLGTTKHFQLFFEWTPVRTRTAWTEIKKWWTELNIVGCRV